MKRQISPKKSKGEKETQREKGIQTVGALLDAVVKKTLRLPANLRKTTIFKNRGHILIIFAVQKITT